MVRFFDNGQLVGELEMGDIPIGESMDVSIPWIATKGNHEIVVRIPRNGNGFNYKINGTFSELSEKYLKYKAVKNTLKNLVKKGYLLEKNEIFKIP